MGILNANSYQKGYDEGYKTAMDGKEPNYIKAGLNPKYWFVNADVAWETYVEGYKEGYRIGCRDRARKNN